MRAAERQAGAAAEHECRDARDPGLTESRARSAILHGGATRRSLGGGNGRGANGQPL